MKLFKHNDNKVQISWLQILTIFLLGALVVSNLILFLNAVGVEKELAKLKADDIAIAQAINNLYNQTKTK